VAFFKESDPHSRDQLQLRGQRQIRVPSLGPRADAGPEIRDCASPYRAFY